MITGGISGRIAVAAWTAAGALLAGALLASATARADVTLVSGLPQAPKVSAAGEAMAWSTYETATGQWRLVVRSGGVTQTLPIPGRATPFDVDLGEDGHGGLVASYSRCSATAQSGELPHGCDLYYYEFATGAEHPVTVANATGFSQFDPSMAAGRVAFARIADGRRVGAGNRVHLFVQSLAGGKPRQLRGGFENNNPGTGPTALDLSATALAFSWNAKGPTAFEPYSLETSQVSVDQLSGGQTLVALGTSGETSSAKELSPTLTASGVDYGEASFEEGANSHQYRSLSLPGAHAAVALGPSNLQSTATSPGGTIYSRCTASAEGFPIGPPCEVAIAERVAYTNPDSEIAQLDRPTTISMSPQQSIEQSPGHVAGNWLAWSAYDPAGHDYRLMLRGPEGVAKPAPVPPRSVPFDVELGPRAGGGLIAVYSRCHTEPRLDPRDMLPLPSTGRGCRLYRYDIGSSGERLIPGSGSRFLPSVWNNTLAYAALGANGQPLLFIGSLNGRTAPRALPGGPVGSATGLGPRALVLQEKLAAFVWEYKDRSGLHSQIRLDNTNTPAQRLLDGISSRSGALRELSPAFTHGVLAWARREAAGHSQIDLYGLSNRQVSRYLAPDPIEALATNHLVVENHLASGEAFYAVGEGGSGATIRHLITRFRELPAKLN